MSIGDIIIMPTTPPHIASVVSATEAVCEDGVTRTIITGSSVAYTALEFLQALERGLAGNA